MRTHALLACLSVSLVAGAGVALAGDASYRSPNHFALRVPAGWERIDQRRVQQASRLAASAMGVRQQAYEAGFQREGAEHDFAFPYVLIRFEAGNTSGAYRDLEKQIEDGVEKAKAKHGKALEEHLGPVSFDRPTVDKVRHRVWMTMNADTPDDGPMRAFLAAHLGREGVAQIAFYTTADRAETDRLDFVAFSDSLKFDDGHTFRTGGIFDGILGKALLGGILGAVFALVRGLLKRRARALAPPLPPTGRFSVGPPPLPPGQPLAPAFRYVPTRARSAEPAASAPHWPDEPSP